MSEQQDRLDRIRRQYLGTMSSAGRIDPERLFRERAPADVVWLVGEVERLRQAQEAIYRRSNVVFDSKDAEIERLRGLLGRLEWAYCACYQDGSCPACDAPRVVSVGDGTVRRGDHAPDCWLAALIHKTP
jgi:hypothetical protein